ncbi:MAG: phosphohistidine phosphatase SixA [Bryobacteraceae bacterium]
MDIYLLRHGIADEPRPGLADADRALTGPGREKLRRVLQRAKSAQVSPSLILSSPLRRALETAQLASELLGCDKIVKTESLVPSSAPEEVWQEISKHAREQAILLAGHEPLFGMSVAYLLACPPLRIDFKKAALARIEMEKITKVPHGILKWMITPGLA